MPLRYSSEAVPLEVDGESYCFVPHNLIVARVSTLAARILRKARQVEVSEDELVAVGDRATTDGVSSALEELHGIGALESSEAPPHRLEPPVGHPLPVNIALHLTGRCTQKCIYCYGDGGAYGGAPADMAPDTARRAVDLLLNNLLETDQPKGSILFFGGEPLLNMPVLQYVVEYANHRARTEDKQISFAVTTNGTLLSDQTQSVLKALSVRVQVSLDGPAAVQDRQRPMRNGHGSFACVSRNLSGRAQDFTARMTTLTPHIWEPVMRTVAMGFRGVHIEPASGELGGPLRSPEAQRMLIADWERLCRALSDSAGQPLMVLRRESSRLAVKGIRHYGCGAGRNYIAVNTDGALYLCHRFVGQDEFRVGSVTEGFGLPPLAWEQGNILQPTLWKCDLTRVLIRHSLLHYIRNQKHGQESKPKGG